MLAGGPDGQPDPDGVLARGPRGDVPRAAASGRLARALDGVVRALSRALRRDVRGRVGAGSQAPGARREERGARPLRGRRRDVPSGGPQRRALRARAPGRSAGRGRAARRRGSVRVREALGRGARGVRPASQGGGRSCWSFTATARSARGWRRARPPAFASLGSSRTGSRLAAALASADVLVHGCPYETFGLGVAEAVACGLPVVVPDARGRAGERRTGLRRDLPEPRRRCVRGGDHAHAGEGPGRAPRARTRKRRRAYRPPEEHVARVVAVYEAMLRAC